MVIPWEDFLEAKMNKGVIYGYKINGEMKYIGQTKNIKSRHNRHIKTDPFNLTTREYNYPLSRAIRKYGVDAIELVILEEDVKDGDLNEREQYFIALYDTHKNQYNQTVGGATWGYSKYPQSLIREIKQNLKNQVSHKDIKLQTGVSYTHIFNIDNGIRCASDNEKYPLSGERPVSGGKLLDIDIIQIIDLLQNTDMSQSSIASLFNVTQTTISRINLGKRINIPNKINYLFPLRK